MYLYKRKVFLKEALVAFDAGVPVGSVVAVDAVDVDADALDAWPLSWCCFIELITSQF